MSANGKRSIEERASGDESILRSRSRAKVLSARDHTAAHQIRAREQQLFPGTRGRSLFRAGSCGDDKASEFGGRVRGKFDICSISRKFGEEKFAQKSEYA